MKNLGTSEQAIETAESNLGLKFPLKLKSIWKTSNGLELPGGWQFFPVFDPADPKKTCNHIGYENIKGRWPYMNAELISIAAGDTGNQLVLKKSGDSLEETIFFWDHETNKTRKWGKDLEYIQNLAKKRIEQIELQINKSMNRSKSKS